VSPPQKHSAASSFARGATVLSRELRKAFPCRLAFGDGRLWFIKMLITKHCKRFFTGRRRPTREAEFS
jgi:hypothetical protein